MGKIISSIILLTCSILLLYMNRKYRKSCLSKVHLYGVNAFFFDLFFDVPFFVYITNYLFPVCTHIIFGYSVLQESDITPLELTQVYIVETLSWWIFYHTFYIMCKKNKGAVSYKMQKGHGIEIITTFILLLYIASRISTLGKLEEEPSEWEQRFFFIIPFVNIVGYMLAIFITFGGKKYFSTYVWLLSLVATGVFFLGAFLGGIRGAIVNPIVWAAYVVYKMRLQSIRKWYFLFFGVVLVGFSLIQPIFMGFRSMNAEEISLNEKMETAQLIANNRYMQNTDSRYETRNIFHEMDFRYGAEGMYTVGFYRLVDLDGFVGLNCILNSFYTFMPSMLVGTDKPVSTSSDGTLYGMGMYKCVNAIDGSENMCGFFTSGHAYWEFGIIGVILFSIIPALFDFYCIRLFSRMDMIGLPLYTAIFMKAYTCMKMWVSLIVVEFAQIILPVILLIIFYQFMSNGKKVIFIRRKVSL